MHPSILCILYCIFFVLRYCNRLARLFNLCAMKIGIGGTGFVAKNWAKITVTAANVYAHKLCLTDVELLSHQDFIEFRNNPYRPYYLKQCVCIYKRVLLKEGLSISYTA